MFRFPVQNGRASSEMHQYYRFAEFGKLDQQVMLCIGHLDVHARGALSGHLTGFSHGSDDDICLVCDTQCLRLHLLRAARVAHLTAEHSADGFRFGVIHEV